MHNPPGALLRDPRAKPPPHPHPGRWIHSLRWIVAITLAIACALGSPLPTGAQPTPDDPEPARAHHRIIVKLESEGPSAVTECAETLVRRGRRFVDASADGSDSLDRLFAKLGVRETRALFRRPSGPSFDAERRRLQERLEDASRRHPQSPRRAARAPATRSLPELAHVYRVELAPDTDIDGALADFRADPHVAWAQPDYRVTAQWLPDDPFLQSAGSWGQLEADLWGLDIIEAPVAWDFARGEEIVVAVLDSGLDYDHPDIAANAWINAGEDLDANGVVDASDFNGIDDDGNGFVDDLHGFDFASSVDADEDGSYDGPDDISDSDPFDDHGHGTHVAGTIAAVADNGYGIAGVAPSARIMGIKGISNDGSGFISDLAQGILYAVANGADVVNNSWSCSERCPVNPVIEEAILAADAAGVIPVFSAGNKTDDVVHYSPQNMRETLVVGASTPADTLTDFSNFGLLVDVVAPGGGLRGSPGLFPTVNILSLRASGTRDNVDLNGLLRVEQDFLRLSGTSMSAPHAAGLVALLLSAEPQLEYEEVRAILRQTSDQLAVPVVSVAAGRINARRALDPSERFALFAAIDAPVSGAVISQREDELTVVGSAGGEDFASYQLHWGRDRTPSSWLPIGEPQTTPVEDGVLGRWSIEDRANGSHAVKVTVTGRSGRQIEEFAVLSFERNPPVRISPPGPSARRPQIDGHYVVWDSPREAEATTDEESPETEPEEEEEDTGLNVFLTDLRDGRTYPISEAPGEQRFANVAGSRVAFRDQRPEAGDSLSTCLFSRKKGRCVQERRLIDVGPSASRPYILGERLVWTDWRVPGGRIFSCSIEGDRDHRAAKEICPVADETAPSPFDQTLLRSDDRRLVWNQRGNGVRVASCVFDPATGDCPVEVLPQTEEPARLEPVVSGNLFAWELPSLLGASLVVCELDPGTGECPPLVIDEEMEPLQLDISGRRIVWQDSRRDDGLEIFFCEYDRIRRACPVQRLTGSAADQRKPAIDGTHVVWEDRRNGVWEIFGTELPSIEVVGDGSVDEGRTLRIAVRAHDPRDEPIELFANSDSQPVEEVGASFTDFGDGTGELVWTPGFEQAGSVDFTFRMRTAGNLASRESIRVEVRDVNRPPEIEIDGPTIAALGSRIRLDACRSADPDGDALRFSWRDLHGRELGDECRLEIDGPEATRLEFYGLTVDDGERRVGSWHPVWWLPQIWIDWLAARATAMP